MADNKESWESYQRYILSEIQRLNEGQQEIQLKREEFDKKVNEKLDQIIALNGTVSDIKKWKEERAEPSIQELKTYKEQAKTIGTVVQIVIAAVVSYISSKLWGNSGD